MKYRSLCDGFLEDGNDFQRKLSAFITEYTEIPTQSTLRTFLCSSVLQNFLCVLLSPSTLCASVLFGMIFKEKSHHSTQSTLRFNHRVRGRFNEVIHH